MKIKDDLNIFISLNNEELKGTPIAVKDNFLTKGLRTTAGSKILNDFIPAYSATVVKKLEENGYFVVGKTNLDAWCHGSSTETSDYGPTLNPWNKERVAGGSSGGSAAAVAAGIVDVAIGSETAGSVRGPAAWCGVVGLKPTYGRVSRYGVIAMGSSLDCPGVLAKNVTSAAKVLKVIAGKDANDSTSSDQPVDDYEKHTGETVKGLKVGIVKDYFLKEMDKEVIKRVKDAIIVMQDLGVEFEEVETVKPEYAIGVYTVVQRSEVSSNLARYDGIRYGKDRTYFGEEAKRRIMLGTYTLSSGYQDKYYKKALKVRTLYIEDFNRLFKKYDLLVAPTMPGPAPKLGVSINQPMFGEMADVLTEPAAIAGIPAITVPCGFVDEMPIGISFMAKQFDEKTMIKLAFAYEAATKWHLERPEK